MYSLSPSLESRDASANLSRLLAPEIDADRFRSAIWRLQKLFEIYAATCPAPLIAPGVIVTPELRLQSEFHLPLAGITSAFNLLYRAALRYPAILSSTPFHNALSWADVFAGLPPRFQFAVNPARLLENLLSDRDLRTEFLFASFLPRRFYGGFDRYPQQSSFVRQWLGHRQAKPLRCLDAACGTGEQSYALAGVLLELGYAAEQILVEGWTLEPLEVWAAAHCSFPQDRLREQLFRRETSRLFETGYSSRILFSCADLTASPAAEPFELILCNGLLGGPILNRFPELERVMANLAGLLAPGGLLLVADSFHQGWKQKCPQHQLRAFLEMNGLNTFQAGEGIGGLKPD
ncbi:MAG: hypothetical protein A2X82_08445 [Geobacteraceae bacterium GWC2_55_20]|nr:MAG: hypothetical protein A2X82_08445 [Geobacteraceae bacterium GWC2_55_20]OGU22140.1 MAG: hypothetical protein A2X85_04235 [Geobacteraceae bacterium GWF2_54_21]HCE67054.1 chemotaxis protein CheR [Geobacter sp.]